MKQATTIDKQIDILRSRNVIISDEEKAKEILLDIGYYRLGFYFFPFEETFPSLDNRTHLMKVGTRFEYAVYLYYFDCDIRNILMRYISRIEVSFRTYTTYILSNKYVANPYWFVDNKVVTKKYINDFDDKYYSVIRNNEAIRKHHIIHPDEKYAPAWKTLEFMTMGNMVYLYRNLVELTDKRIISEHFGIERPEILENYLEVLRSIRNICAHGSVLYRTHLFHRIRRGPLKFESNIECQSLGGAIKIIAYIMGIISQNRQHEMIISLNEVYRKAIKNATSIKDIIIDNTVMSWDLHDISRLETK